MVTMVTDRRPILEPESARGKPQREMVSQVSHLTLQPILYTPIVMLMPPSSHSPPYGNALSLV